MEGTRVTATNRTSGNRARVATWASKVSSLLMGPIIAGFALSACGTDASPEGDVYSQLPYLAGSEANEVEDITDLMSRADLVVIGTITQVKVVDLGTSKPAPTEAPNLVQVTFKTEFTIQPRGGGDPVVVAMSSWVGADDAKKVREGISRASLPRGLTVFALQGPYEDWGYACVSFQAYWCPLEVVGTSWHSPRSPDWDALTAMDPLQPGTKVGDVIDALAETYGFEVRGH